MSSLQAQLDQMMAEFNRTTDAMQNVQKRLAASSHTKRSKNRMVSITLDNRGEITDLTFHTTAYRTMAPQELSELLLGLIREVRTAAQEEVQRVVGGFMPGGGELIRKVAAGGSLDKDEIFGELEKVFAWGRQNEAAPTKAKPKAAPVPDEQPADEGWTGERKAVAKPAPAARRKRED